MSGDTMATGRPDRIPTYIVDGIRYAPGSPARVREVQQNLTRRLGQALTVVSERISPEFAANLDETIKQVEELAAGVALPPPPPGLMGIEREAATRLRLILEGYRAAVSVMDPQQADAAETGNSGGLMDDLGLLLCATGRLEYMERHANELAQAKADEAATPEEIAETAGMRFAARKILGYTP